MLAVWIWSTRNWSTEGNDRQTHATRETTAVQAPAEPELQSVEPRTAIDPDRDIRGLVLQANDQRPIAGALIEALHLPGRGEIDFARMGLIKPETVASVRSREDGTFALADVGTSKVTLRVTAVGFLPIEVGPYPSGARVEIELDAGAPWTVRVEDAEGRPVKGAHVYVRRRTHRKGAFALESITGEEGAATFPIVPGGEKVTVEAVHSDHGSIVNHKAVPHEPLRLRYRGGRVLRGRIVAAETNAPITGAEVGRYGISRFRVRSAADGTFVWPAWRDGPAATLTVEATGYEFQTLPVNGAGEVTIKMRRGGTLIGSLVGANGSPPVGCVAWVRGTVFRNNTVAPFTRTAILDESGRFEITDLIRGSSLRINFAGRLRYSVDFSSDIWGAGARVDVGEIRVPPMHRIVGRITRGGKPADRVFVSAVGGNPDLDKRLRGGERVRFTNKSPIRLFARTDERGRFTFAPLPPGTYELTIQPRGGSRIQRRAVIGESDAELTVELPAGRAFAVTVVNSAGEPAVGIALSLVAGGETLNGETDNNGIARFNPTEPPTRVYWWQARRSLVNHRIEGDASSCRIVVPELLPVSGRVVAADGEPFANAVLRAYRGEHLLAMGDADANGVFKLLVADGPPIRVVFEGRRSGNFGHSRDGSNGNVQDIAPGATGLELKLSGGPSQPLTDFRIRVLYPDGTPVEGASVSPWSRHERTDQNGLLEVKRRKGSKLTLRVKFASDEFAMPRPTVAPLDTDECELRLRLAAPITGIVMRQGVGIPNVSLWLRRDGDFLTSATTDSAGRFKLVVAAEETGALTIVVREKGVPDLRREGVKAGSTDLTIAVDDERSPQDD